MTKKKKKIQKKHNSIDIEAKEEDITNSEIEDIINFNNLKTNELEIDKFDIYENKEEQKESSQTNNILNDVEDIYKILNISKKEI